MALTKAHARGLEDRKLQCPNCSDRMTLQSMKRNVAQPSSCVVYECKPCKLSITETIKDGPDSRTLQ